MSDDVTGAYASRVTRRTTVAVVLLGLAGLLPPLALLLGLDALLDGPLPVVLTLAAACAAGAWLGRVAVPAAVLLVGVLVVVNQLNGAGYHPLDDLVFYATVVAGPAAAGAAVTARNRQVARLDELRVELARQQEAQVRAARLEEQARVEQQVHSHLAERIAAVAVHAEGARRTRDPRALAAIETEARGVLDQLRDALGSLATGPVPEAGAPDRGRGPEAGGDPAEPDRAGQVSVSRTDVALATVLLLTLAVEVAVSSVARGPLFANLVAAVAVTVPLAWRRSRPLTAVAGFAVAGLVTTLLLTPLPATVTGVALLLVVFHAAGAYGGARWPLLAVLAIGAALLMLVPMTQVAPEAPYAVPLLALAAVAVGRATARAEDRVRRTRALLDAVEAGRDAAVRLATAEERRDQAARLHDTVAHAMTVVCVQAGGQQRTGGDPDAALRTISSTAGAALAELRDDLEDLERGDRPLDRSRIAAVARRVGVDLDVQAVPVDATGRAAALAFRVVREAVVNVARHAPGALARVRVRQDAAALDVEVVDDGAATGSLDLGAGRGLTGLRDAVRAAGGRLEWGPAPGGGFRVTARIPVEAA